MQHTAKDLNAPDDWNEKNMDKLRKLYIRWCGSEPAGMTRLEGAGSNRAYYRIERAEGGTVIGCVGTSHEENRAFVYLSRHFTALQLPVPEILAVDDDEMRYLQTDLGQNSLFGALRNGREAGGVYSPEEEHLLRLTIRRLPEL
jgi:aminoglycoside/choline kinase family phosphotransferase